MRIYDKALQVLETGCYSITKDTVMLDIEYGVEFELDCLWTKHYQIAIVGDNDRLTQILTKEEYYNLVARFKGNKPKTFLEKYLED